MSHYNHATDHTAQYNPVLNASGELIRSHHQVLYKLGGGTVANAEAIQASVEHLNWDQSPVIVVSAPAGITDLLTQAADALAQQQLKNAQACFNEIIHRFGDIARQLLSPTTASHFLQQWQLWIDTHATSAYRAQLQARGELWNAQLIAAYLSTTGKVAQPIDARHIIKADGHQTEAIVFRLNQYWPSSDIVPVVTGYIAHTEDDQGQIITTTLGRDGSDYTAALLAEALQVKRVYFFTDTAGIRSADPKLLGHSGQLISCLGHREAKTLIHWGGGVLHERTIKPLIRANTHACIGLPGKLDQYTHVVPGNHWPNGGLGLFLSRAKDDNSATIIVPTPPQQANLVTEQKDYYQYLHEQTINEFRQYWPQSEDYGDGIEIPFPSNTTTHFHTTKDASLITECHHLQQIHTELYEKPQTIKLILIGPGLVGSEVLRQLTNIDLLWRLKYKLAIEVHQVVNTKGTHWQENPELPTLFDYKQMRLVNDVIDQAVIIVDTTASKEVAAHHAIWLVQGAVVVTANKHGLARSFNEFQQLANNPRYAASTTVGAGLPFIDALQQVAQSQAESVQIQAILSGSVNYLLTQLEQGHDYSEALVDAQRKGLLEPEPSADLEGWDSARKLLILARTLGWNIELKDIQREPLFTNPDAAHIKDLLVQARAENKVIRYIAQIDQHGCCLLNTRKVPINSPLNVQTCHNALVIQGGNIAQTCLSGPGAGPVTTAQGILRDVLDMANNLLADNTIRTEQAA